MSGAEPVTLALVSHTNVGKTTLARTLLRRDIGEVRDEAHVTELSEVHTIIETKSGCLRLYDTPGLGDTIRLLRRLRGESNPVGWLIAQAWDRVANRPLWSSQQAIRTARDQTDVVLYLVNAAEAPEHAGYVAPELDLLTWVGRPVVMLLNQTGPARPRKLDGLRDDPALAEMEPEARWRSHASSWPIVRAVLTLDAFTRCWVHEGLLFERIAPLLPEGKRPVMQACLDAWNERNAAVFRRSMERMAVYLVAAAADREPLAGSPVAGLSRASRRRATAALRGRLESATRALVGELIAAHGLDGEPTALLRRSLEDFSITGHAWLTPARGAALGGVATGALGGLAADLALGGLSFGGGAVAGAIVGALGGAGVGQAYRLAGRNRVPAASWSEAFLGDLCRQTALRYLAVAHFGRGRGGYADAELPATWRQAVNSAFGPVDPRLPRLWRAAARDGIDRATVEDEAEQLLAERIRAVLSASYPEAAHLLRA